MKIIHALASGAMLIAVIGGAAVPAGAAPLGAAVVEQGEAYARGRILVMPRRGLPEADFASIVGAHGGKARRLGTLGVYVVELPAAASERATVAALANHPHIKFAELDQRVAPDLVVNDPYLGSEWHLTKIGAPAAWDTSEGSGVKIAILDTGVDGTHPDLVARMVAGWNFYDNNPNTSDVNGHGTIVAGAAAASSNNGVGVASIAGKAWIMPVRIADPTAYAYWSTVAQGINWAADNGARVANLSYGGAARSSTVQNAAQYLRSKGGLLIVSAGNNAIDEGITPTTSMIPVSATDGNDALASWSSYGSFVALSAPGAGIYSTASGGSYTAASGTSVAAPVTAGVVALMMAAKPSMSNADIETLLYRTAIDLGAAGRDPYYGYGRVNASGAVQAVLSASVPPGDTTPPATSITAPSAGATVSGVATVDVSATDNVGVARVDLRVNGTTIASDTTSPFGFSWDTTKFANGMASLVALAYDAAGNAAASASVSVNVSNAADTTPPAVSITNPLNGSKVSGTVSVNVTASDDKGAAGITQALYIDGTLKATASGAALTYSWNTRKIAAGLHTVQAVARDAAGNSASSTLQVSK